MNEIRVQNSGYVHCESCFYTCQDILSSQLDYKLNLGINILSGEIDSGIWALSYLLSMYKYRPKDFVLFEQPNIMLDNKIISLLELTEISCYMDRIYPLFSAKKSVDALVSQGLRKTKLGYSSEDIRNMFFIDKERFRRPLTGVGNEMFKAMAAIGFCNKKEIFCFPWLSSTRFDSYHKNLSGLLDILDRLNKVVIVPTGHRSVNQKTQGDG